MTGTDLNKMLTGFRINSPNNPLEYILDIKKMLAEAISRLEHNLAALTQIKRNSKRGI